VLFAPPPNARAAFFISTAWALVMLGCDRSRYELSTIARHAGLSTGKFIIQGQETRSIPLATLLKSLGVPGKWVDRPGKDSGICALIE